MLHVGLDLIRKRLDVHVLDGQGSTLAVTSVPPDADGLHGVVVRLDGYGEPVRAAVESMTGARFIHDQLELAGWEVDVADAQKVKGLAPLACKTDKIDATALKCRIHAVLMNLGHPCPVSDLFGVAGRQLLEALQLPEPWTSTVAASLAVIDELDHQIAACDAEIRQLGAAHPYVPLLRTAPGIGWTLASTIASEIGDIRRFSSPKKLCGYTGLGPRVQQSGARDRRGALAKNGPRHLRWALVEAAVMAARHRCIASTTSRPRRESASSAARRSLASKSHANSPKRSGTCSHLIRRFLRQTPPRFWPQRRPLIRIGLPDQRSHSPDPRSRRP